MLLHYAWFFLHAPFDYLTIAYFLVNHRSTCNCTPTSNTKYLCGSHTYTLLSFPCDLADVTKMSDFSCRESGCDCGLNSVQNS